MTQYLRYVLKNVEPIRIADDSTSQSGQTVSLKYIPGTTIRGLVINRLAQQEDFEEIKKLLFSEQVRYLNAYLMVGEKELIPSPKGFYEDKVQVSGKKQIENVVINGEFKEGNKRAALGRFCSIEGDCIYYCNVDTGSDMKIKINLQNDEKQNVFRNEYIMPGHVFAGYIAVETEEVKNAIKEVFGQNIIIGNARSAGLGKCQVLSCDYVDRLPYEEYLPQEEQTGSCYMMLLSGTAMRNEIGELCGIHEKKLQEMLGVENLKLAYCSTSTIDVKGYNRKWGVKVPSMVMFEQGSVFHLTFDGVLTVEKLRQVCDKGIGVRANEGFGRVLFLKDYAQVCYKVAMDCQKALQPEVKAAVYAEDEQVLRKVASCYYRNKLQREMEHYVVQPGNELGGGSVSASQLGVVMSIITAYKYEPAEAVSALKRHLEHALEKEKKQNTQKQRGSVRKLKQQVQDILGKDLETTLGMEPKDRIMGISRAKLFSEEEETGMKLTLLTNMIRYKNKEGGR